MEPQAPTRRCLSLARKPAQLPGRHAHRASVGGMVRRVVLGAVVALAAGWVLTGAGGSPPARSAEPAPVVAANVPPHPDRATSSECTLHARVTVDRSPAVMVALRICLRP